MIRHQFRQIAKCKIAFFGIVVHFNLQILKIIHLVCLSFWDISRDPGFRISISVQKMWPLDAADLVHADLYQTEKNAPAKDPVYIKFFWKILKM